MRVLGSWWAYWMETRPNPTADRAAFRDAFMKAYNRASAFQTFDEAAKVPRLETKKLSGEDEARAWRLPSTASGVGALADTFAAGRLEDGERSEEER